MARSQVLCSVPGSVIFFLGSFPHPQEIGLDYIISEATTSSLVSLTFQGQANTCEWPNSVPYLEYKRKIFLSLLVSSGKWLLFSS